MTELLPCPFCGGEAHIVGGDDFFYNVVQCCNCHATASGRYETEAEAIAAWNTRAERTCRNISRKLGNDEFTCEECCARVYGCRGEWFDANWEYHPFNYCPNCGAKVVQDG